jgi:hypothetical protein
MQLQLSHGGKAGLLAIVLLTVRPNKMAPAKLKIEAIMTAVLMLMTPAPTDVPNELLTYNQ